MAYQRIVSTGSVYKGKTGMWLYIFHRVTGVGLFGYLLLHIISTALILLGPEIYEGAEAIYKNFYFRVAEIGLMAAVLGHAINGLRIIAVDLWKKGSDYQKQLNFVSLFIFSIRCHENVKNTSTLDSDSQRSVSSLRVRHNGDKFQID